MGSSGAERIAAVIFTGLRRGWWALRRALELPIPCWLSLASCHAPDEPFEQMMGHSLRVLVLAISESVAGDTRCMAKAAATWLAGAPGRMHALRNSLIGKAQTSLPKGRIRVEKSSAETQ
jgi:hypothetical protein